MTEQNTELEANERREASECSDLLAAPCIFCGYNGQGYWQRGTHHGDCPWHMVGGGRDRKEKLPELVRKLFVLGMKAENYIDESPCDPDITNELADAYYEYQKALSDVRNFGC